MSFILPNFDNCDVISFYVRSDFTNHDNMIVSHYINRNDIFFQYPHSNKCNKNKVIGFLQCLQLLLWLRLQ